MVPLLRNSQGREESLILGLAAEIRMHSVVWIPENIFLDGRDIFFHYTCGMSIHIHGINLSSMSVESGGISITGISAAGIIRNPAEVNVPAVSIDYSPCRTPEEFTVNMLICFAAARNDKIESVTGPESIAPVVTFFLPVICRARQFVPEDENMGRRVECNASDAFSPLSESLHQLSHPDCAPPQYIHAEQV